MSKFYKALEQAQRDRGLASQGRRPTPPVAPAARPPAEASRPATTRPPRRSRREELDLLPDGVDDHLVSLVAPSAFEAEQYRALRYLVEQRHRSSALSVIAVSSPAVGDGKTTTAINLAGTLAQASETRVLLVEADLRRPSIGQMLGFPDHRGPGLVTAILDPSVTLEDVVRKRPPFNLSVILAGQTPPSPYEILKSPRLGDLLDEARQQYDYIVVDTPPLVSVQDCRVIARWIDGAIVVVAAHRTPRRLVDEALAVLDPAKVLGLVFNGDDPLLTGYGSYVASAAGDDRRGRWGRTMRKLGSSFGRRAASPREGRSRRREP